MFLDYSSRNEFADVNSAFAEKYIEILYIERLEGPQFRLEYIKSRAKHIPEIQNLQLKDLRGNFGWLTYLHGIILSREQMIAKMDLLLKCSTLYMVEFSLEGCSPEYAFLQNDNGEMKYDRLTKAVRSTYIDFLKPCENIIESLQSHFIASRPQKKLPFSQFDYLQKVIYQELFPKADGPFKMHVGLLIMPIKFPTSFREVIGENGCPKSAIKLRFHKWTGCKAGANLHSLKGTDVRPSLIENRIISVWKAGDPRQLFDYYAQLLKVGRISLFQQTSDETTIVMKEIELRVDRRNEKIGHFEDVLSLSSTALYEESELSCAGNECIDDIETTQEYKRSLISSGNLSGDVVEVDADCSRNPHSLLNVRSDFRNEGLFESNDVKDASLQDVDMSQSMETTSLSPAVIGNKTIEHSPARVNSSFKSSYKGKLKLRLKSKSKPLVQTSDAAKSCKAQGSQLESSETSRKSGIYLNGQSVTTNHDKNSNDKYTDTSTKLYSVVVDGVKCEMNEIERDIYLLLEQRRLNREVAGQVMSPSEASAEVRAEKANKFQIASKQLMEREEAFLFSSNQDASLNSQDGVIDRQLKVAAAKKTRETSKTLSGPSNIRPVRDIVATIERASELLEKKASQANVSEAEPDLEASTQATPLSFESIEFEFRDTATIENKKGMAHVQLKSSIPDLQGKQDVVEPQGCVPSCGKLETDIPQNSAVEFQLGGSRSSSPTTFATQYQCFTSGEAEKATAKMCDKPRKQHSEFQRPSQIASQVPGSCHHSKRIKSSKRNKSQRNESKSKMMRVPTFVITEQESSPQSSRCVESNTLPTNDQSRHITEQRRTESFTANDDGKILWTYDLDYAHDKTYSSWNGLRDNEVATPPLRSQQALSGEARNAPTPHLSHGQLPPRNVPKRYQSLVQRMYHTPVYNTGYGYPHAEHSAYLSRKCHCYLKESCRNPFHEQRPPPLPRKCPTPLQQYSPLLALELQTETGEISDKPFTQGQRVKDDHLCDKSDNPTLKQPTLSVSDNGNDYLRQSSNGEYQTFDIAYPGKETKRSIRNTANAQESSSAKDPHSCSENGHRDFTNYTGSLTPYDDDDQQSVIVSHHLFDSSRLSQDAVAIEPIVDLIDLNKSMEADSTSRPHVPDSLVVDKSLRYGEKMEFTSEELNDLNDVDNLCYDSRDAILSCELSDLDMRLARSKSFECLNTELGNDIGSSNLEDSVSSYCSELSLSSPISSQIDAAVNNHLNNCASGKNLRNELVNSWPLPPFIASNGVIVRPPSIKFEPSDPNYDYYTYMATQDPDGEPELFIRKHSKNKSLRMSEKIRNFVSPLSGSAYGSSRPPKEKRTAFNYDEMYPALSSVRFRDFVKFKAKKLRDDVKYFSDVAKLCVVDFKERPITAERELYKEELVW
ncbi:LANO_0G13850g1_1 [Lachancea nothofagi CBS 11611]|uniref:LANO_0G13850g1_1 n=1 Tax=Lachancea nothofagi CBS 11611 TaxID=1266666 RepID=A0A1G4KK94_9SACH|nr:LANO_0G13850g1_1 [Lachancea nothofagi CBS 11611]